MKQIFILLLIFILLICCSGSKKNNIIDKKDNPDKNEKLNNDTNDYKDISQEVKIKEYVYLFYNKSYFIKKKVVKKEVKKEFTIDQNDYKVIIDWQVKGERMIKLKNIKTGKEYIIKENDKLGEVILVERSLRDYKFKIKNIIIRVKR